MDSFNCKNAVKDSFEEEEGSDDVEDEVFIRDGRTSYKIDDDIGLKRPLMAPRRKCKPLKNSSKDAIKRKCFCHNVCSPYCKISMALFILISIILIAVTMIDNFPPNLEKLVSWTLGSSKMTPAVVPSTEFSSKLVWSRSFPDLRSEDSICSAKLNEDDIDDIIIGYSADEGMEDCGRKWKCLGGALALDGKSGQTLWQHWTRQEVLFVDCSSNVNQEPTHDCLLSGKAGVLCVVDGKTGLLIWELSDRQEPEASVYSAQYIPDMNGDGFPDVLTSHTLSFSSNLSVLSGHSGQVLGRVEAPGGHLFTLPRLLMSQDESLHVVFATGSLETAGALFSIPLYSLIHSDPSKCVKVWSGESGVSSDMVIVDMNLDQYEDIIITSSDTLTVLDGRDRSSVLWNHTLSSSSDSPPSHILIGPTPAYFNDDRIPDLLVTKLVGPSYPNFYFSETLVLNGKDGRRLLDDGLIGSGEITGEGISVSFSGSGNDMFLYWLTTCHQDSNRQTASFSPPQDTMGESVDLCRVRFNNSLESRLYLLSDHIQPPGYLLYSSDLLRPVEEEIVSEKPPAARSQTPAVDQQTQQNPPGNRGGGDRREEGEVEVDMNPWEADYLPVDRLGSLKEMGYEPQLYVQEELPLSPPDYPDGLPKPFDERDVSRDREKRGVQRNYSIPRPSITPVLVPSLSGESVDIVFASLWITPPQGDVECLAQKTSPQVGLSSYELEMMRRQVERQCGGAVAASSKLNVYRASINAQCYGLDKTDKCSQPLPSYSQSFSHRSTHQYFKPRTQ